VTFLYPIWRSLKPLKGSLNHPKKVTKTCQSSGNTCVIFCGFSLLATSAAGFPPSRKDSVISWGNRQPGVSRNLFDLNKTVETFRTVAKLEVQNLFDHIFLVNKSVTNLMCLVTFSVNFSTVNHDLQNHENFTTYPIKRILN